jgi:hypothetical protein
MASAVKRTLGKAAVQRLSGSKPSPLTAFAAAAIVGLGAGVATYRALRSGQ